MIQIGVPRCPWSQVTGAGATAVSRWRAWRRLGEPMIAPSLSEAPAPYVEALLIVDGIMLLAADPGPEG